MHINQILRIIHATVPVPGGGEWVVLGEENLFYQNNLDCDFRLIRRPTKILLQAVGGGGGPQIGTQSQIFLFFFSDSSPELQ